MAPCLFLSYYLVLKLLLFISTTASQSVPRIHRIQLLIFLGTKMVLA